MQSPRPYSIRSANRPVRGGEPLEYRRAWDFHDKTGALITVPAQRPSGADRDRVDRVIDIDPDVRSFFRRPCVFGPADIDRFLVPWRDLDRPVERLDRQPASGLQGIVEVEVLLVPSKPAHVLQISSRQKGERRGQKQYSLRAHAKLLEQTITLRIGPEFRYSTSTRRIMLMLTVKVRSSFGSIQVGDA